MTKVVAAIYNDPGVTRARIWVKTGQEEVREDPAEAGLLKLPIRDLSTGNKLRAEKRSKRRADAIRHIGCSRCSAVS
jgi:hypothetical protein